MLMPFDRARGDLMSVRTITIDITYRDDPDDPRHLNLRAKCNELEAQLSRHLATDVAVWITRDTFGEMADR